MKRSISLSIMWLFLFTIALNRSGFSQDFGDIKLSDKKFLYKDNSFNTIQVHFATGVQPFLADADEVLDFRITGENAKKIIVIKKKNESVEVPVDRIRFIRLVKDTIILMM
jgi:hypothetical protein